MQAETSKPDRSTLAPDALAVAAETTPRYVRRLVEAGAIHANPDGSHAVEDIPKVRLMLALEAGGIDFEELMGLIRSDALQLDWVARLWTVARPSGRTVAEFATSLGDRASQLPAIYAAFGLAVPPSDALMREDEEAALAGFMDLWQMVDDRPEIYLRAARIAGEGIRRVQGATQDLFDELGGPPGYQQQRGKSGEDAFRPSSRLSPVVSQLFVWLQKRHME